MILTLALAVAVPLGAWAQSRAMSLQECLDMAAQGSLQLKAGQLQVEQQRRLQGTAFEMDKTAVTLSQDPSSGGSPDNSLSVSQDFDFPTLYFARRSALKAQTDVSRRQLEVTGNDVERQVSSKYSELVSLRRQVQVLQRQDSIYSRFLEIATAKLSSGDAGTLEKMNAQRVLRENALRLQQTRNDYRAAQMELAVLLGFDGLVEPTDTELRIEPDGSFSEADDMSFSPLAGLYAANVTARQKELTVARQGFLPGISVLLRNQLVIKSFNPYDITRERFSKGDFMGFEVGLSIPLFYGSQRAKLRAAKTGLELARVEQQQSVNELNRDYRAAVNDYRKAEQTLRYYDGEGRQQAEEIARVSQLSYEMGEIDYMEYMQNLEESCSLLLQCAEAEDEYNQSVIKLNYLKGNNR